MFPARKGLGQVPVVTWPWLLDRKLLFFSDVLLVLGLQNAAQHRGPASCCESSGSSSESTGGRHERLCSVLEEQQLADGLM